MNGSTAGSVGVGDGCQADGRGSRKIRPRTGSLSARLRCDLTRAFARLLPPGFFRLPHVQRQRRSRSRCSRGCSHPWFRFFSDGLNQVTGAIDGTIPATARSAPIGQCRDSDASTHRRREPGSRMGSIPFLYFVSIRRHALTLGQDSRGCLFSPIPASDRSCSFKPLSNGNWFG